MFDVWWTLWTRQNVYYFYFDRTQKTSTRELDEKRKKGESEFDAFGHKRKRKNRKRLWLHTLEWGGGGGELCYDRCDKWAPNPPLWSYKIVIAFCLISSNHRESKVEKCRKYSTRKNYPITKNMEKRNVLVLHIAWFFPSFLPLKKKTSRCYCHLYYHSDCFCMTNMITYINERSTMRLLYSSETQYP